MTESKRLFYRTLTELKHRQGTERFVHGGVRAVSDIQAVELFTVLCDLPSTNQLDAAVCRGGMCMMTYDTPSIKRTLWLRTKINPIQVEDDQDEQNPNT
jgi:hypothetical protein